MTYSDADQKLIDTVLNYKEIEHKGIDPLDLIEEALIDGANLFLKIENVNILTYAVKKENIDLLEYLLEVSYKGEKFDIDAYINSKDTILTQTLRSSFSHPDLAKILIEAGCDVNKSDTEGISPLVIAIQHHKINDVELLLDKNANQNYLTPETKISPFLVACQGTSVKVVKKILEKGVDINQVNSIGVNGLILALSSFGMYATKDDKEQRKKIINLLLEENIDVNTVAKSGLTALWSSVGSYKEMDKITQLGADLYAIHNFPQQNVKPFAHQLMELTVTKEKKKYKNKGETDSDNKNQKIEQEEELGIFADYTRKAIFADFRKSIQNSEGNTLEAICAINSLVVKNYPELVPQLFDVDINQFYNVKPTQTHQKAAKLPFLYSIFKNFSESDILNLTNQWINQGKKIDLYVNDKDVAIENQPIICLISTGKLKILRIINSLIPQNINEVEFYNKTNKKLYHITEILPQIINSMGITELNKELNNIVVFLEALEINKKNGITSELVSDPEKVKIQFEKRKKELEINLKKIYDYQEECTNVLKFMGVNFDYVNSSGIPAVFSVKNKINIDLFEKMGADITRLSKSGDNFLVHAILNQNLEIIPVLIEKWKESKPEYISSALNQVFYHDKLNDRVQQSIIEQSMIALFSLYTKEVDGKNEVQYPYINQKDEDGNTPLLIAASNDYNYAVSALFKAGADINAKNNNGETAIMHAIANENFEMVKSLFEKNVDINVTSSEGITIDDLLDDVQSEELIEMVKSYMIGEFNSEKSKIILKRKFR